MKPKSSGIGSGSSGIGSGSSGIGSGSSGIGSRKVWITESIVDVVMGTIGVLVLVSVLGVILLAVTAFE